MINYIVKTNLSSSKEHCKILATFTPSFNFVIFCHWSLGVPLTLSFPLLCIAKSYLFTCPNSLYMTLLVNSYGIHTRSTKQCAE
jgi:hypothetical protein